MQYQVNKSSVFCRSSAKPTFGQSLPASKIQSNFVIQIFSQSSHIFFAEYTPTIFFSSFKADLDERKASREKYDECTRERLEYYRNKNRARRNENARRQEGFVILEWAFLKPIHYTGNILKVYFLKYLCFANDISLERLSSLRKHSYS